MIPIRPGRPATWTSPSPPSDEASLRRPRQLKHFAETGTETATSGDRWPAGMAMGEKSSSLRCLCFLLPPPRWRAMARRG